MRSQEIVLFCEGPIEASVYYGQHRGAATISFSGEDGKCSEENISRMTYSSPVVQFVMEVLRQNGGSYGMAALSGLLKRNRPDLRELMGPIRKFVDQNFECFEIGKHPQSGAWVITLCDKMQDKQLDLSGSNNESIEWAAFFGVEPWVYFDMDKHTATLVEEVKVSWFQEFDHFDSACFCSGFCLHFQSLKDR